MLLNSMCNKLLKYSFLPQSNCGHCEIYFSISKFLNFIEIVFDFQFMTI